MLSRVLATALIGLSALCVTGCRTTRISHDRIAAYERRTITNETRDSLREEILQNLRENLTERDSVAEKTVVTVTLNEMGDTIFRSVMTDRVTVRDRNKVKNCDNIAVYRTSSEGKRDCVAEMKWDNSYVKTTNRTKGMNQSGSTALHGTLKWVFFCLIALIGLTITIKVCLRRA